MVSPHIRLALLLAMLLSIITIALAAEADIPDDVEEIEIDVARLKGMPGVQIVEDTDDVYAAMEEERKVEERAKAEQSKGGKESKKPTKDKSKAKKKGKAKKKSKGSPSDQVILSS